MVIAGVVKLVDALDSKSSGGNSVSVRFRPPAPVYFRALSQYHWGKALFCAFGTFLTSCHLLLFCAIFFSISGTKMEQKNGQNHKEKKKEWLEFHCNHPY